MESHKFFFAVFLIAAAAIYRAHCLTMIAGTVFCDQCKDGQISLFDYPLSGIKVYMACPGGDGKLKMWGEETTNWLGSYTMRMDGTPDLNGCYAQVSSTGQVSSGCFADAGPAKSMRLTFRMFDMEIYSVDPLISQPSQPMSFCQRSPFPMPTPMIPVTPPQVRLPPMPPLPPLPPVPFMEASACPYKKWIMPEYRCYWKFVDPDTKVGVAFGLIANRVYGTDMTLWQAMQGRGDPYSTLLRESTTALLNSYNSLQFPYNTIGVIRRMNLALMGGSTRQVLRTALGFLKANAGSGSGDGVPVTCRFTPCK